MCGPGPAPWTPPGPWRGRFEPLWIASDLVLLRAGRGPWPSPGNVLVVLDDAGAALVDCGFGTTDSLGALGDGLRAVGRDIASVHTVVCTHPHADHAGGLTALTPGCRALVPPGSAAPLRDPVAVAASILPGEVVELAPWLAGLDIIGHFRRDCGATPVPPGVDLIEMTAGQEVRLGRYTFTAVHTPGHDASLTCYWEPTLGMLVYSDLLVTRGTAIPWYAPGGGGTAAYRASLRRVAALEPRLGVSGHGELLTDSSQIAESIRDTDGQIVARTDRISAALADGPVTFAQLERCVYPPAVHDVIPWASSVAAVHLFEALESGTARPANGAFAAT